MLSPRKFRTEHQCLQTKNLFGISYKNVSKNINTFVCCILHYYQLLSNHKNFLSAMAWRVAGLSFKHQTFLFGFKSILFSAFTPNMTGNKFQLYLWWWLWEVCQLWFLALPIFHIRACRACSGHWAGGLQQRPEAATSLLSLTQIKVAPALPRLWREERRGEARKETSYCSHDHSPCCQLLAPI